jgi:hypothetical protein
MPIRLDKIPPFALRPQRPRFLLWLGLLLLFCLLGVAVTLLFADETLPQRPSDFWHSALSIPLLVWCVLGFGRVLFRPQSCGQLKILWERACSRLRCVSDIFVG